MAIAVEYENRSGPARWQQPPDLTWNYEQFAAASSGAAVTESPIVVPLVFESKFLGHGAMEAWTINGKSYPDSRVAPSSGAGATVCNSSTKVSTTILFIYTAIVSSCASLVYLSPRASGSCPRRSGAS